PAGTAGFQRRRMKLYLDDNLADPALIGRLTKAGHNVVRPADVALTGASDARHLEHAIFDNRTQMTCDSDDFKDLHRLIVTACGRRPRPWSEPSPTRMPTGLVSVCSAGRT